MNGSAPERLQVLDRGLDDVLDVGNAAAAGGHGHALAGPNLSLQPQAGELAVDGRPTSSTRMSSKCWRRRNSCGKPDITTRIGGQAERC